MSNRRWTWMTALALTAAAVSAHAASGDKAALQNERNQRLKAIFDHMPAKQRELLSAAGRNLIARVNGNQDVDRPGGIDEHDRPFGRRGRPPLGPRDATTHTPVSNPGADLAFSRLAGFTQNETSTAWCGDNAVVGFNDSGSFLETLPIPGIGISFNGVSRSTDRGRTFTDLGFLNPGSSIDFELLGDPALACTDANTFYYSSLFIDFGPFTSSVSVSKSNDGGLTFADPVKAAEKSISGHFLDKNWMAVDPTNSNNVYVTYTDFDSTGSICGTSSGFTVFRVGIELAKSSDGGATWAAPVLVSSSAESCTTTGATQGSQVVVDGSGRVHVAWEQFTLTGLEIHIAKSTDGGGTFGGSVKVTDVNEAGELGDLQGSIRVNEFPTLAVDRSGGPSTGTLHLAWNDGNLVAFDGVFGLDYGFTDVFATRSTDAGATWSTPVRVNNNVEPLTAPPEVAGRGTDQFMPGIAVDKRGTVGLCFYDRRNDPFNFKIDRRCVESADGGATWDNSKPPRNDRSFISVTNQDVLLAIDYMGDYDGLASDFNSSSQGFVGAFGDNKSGDPDVQATFF